jgi:hypothetical protein
MSSSAAVPITVAVRIRPMSSREKASGEGVAVSATDTQHISIVKHEVARQYLKSQQRASNTYCFDAALSESSTQEDVYRQAVQSRVGATLEGKHVTLFAYGCTGSGKTYTMLGAQQAGNAGVAQLTGVIPQALREVFDDPRASAHSFEVSYLEIYQERIYDILQSDGSGTSLPLREDPKRGVTEVAGLTRREIQTVQDAISAIHEGSLRRKVAGTRANDTSSRSHAILQVYVTNRSTGNTAVLSMVDLAGSERGGVAAADRARLKEATCINQSLLALGNVINSLSSFSSGNAKYRDSKLTHMLKGSLSGNCYVSMIVCVSPSSATYEDTHNALKYANRAKEIKVPQEKADLSVAKHLLEAKFDQKKAAPPLPPIAPKDVLGGRRSTMANGGVRKVEGEGRRLSSPSPCPAPRAVGRRSLAAVPARRSLLDRVNSARDASALRSVPSLSPIPSGAGKKRTRSSLASDENQSQKAECGRPSKDTADCEVKPKKRRQPAAVDEESWEQAKKEMEELRLLVQKRQEERDRLQSILREQASDLDAAVGLVEEQQQQMDAVIAERNRMRDRLQGAMQLLQEYNDDVDVQITPVKQRKRHSSADITPITQKLQQHAAILRKVKNIKLQAEEEY